jgi:pyruvate dehydrogenase E1 component alpha subunit
MRSLQVDGFDPIATWRALRAAAQHAREGHGPVFVEALTYRLGPHSGASDWSYMPKDELAAAMERDPGPAFRKRMVDAGTLTADTLDDIDAKAAETVSDALRFGSESPPPASDVLFDDVFSDRSAVPSRSASWRRK